MTIKDFINRQIDRFNDWRTEPTREGQSLSMCGADTWALQDAPRPGSAADPVSIYNKQLHEALAVAIAEKMTITNDCSVLRSQVADLEAQVKSLEAAYDSCSTERNQLNATNAALVEANTSYEEENKVLRAEVIAHLEDNPNITLLAIFQTVVAALPAARLDYARTYLSERCAVVPPQIASLAKNLHPAPSPAAGSVSASENPHSAALQPMPAQVPAPLSSDCSSPAIDQPPHGTRVPHQWD